MDGPHGQLWAVARRGEPVAAGGRAVAVTRHRADAALLAASLSALAVPNRLRLAGKGKCASCLALAVEPLDAEELPILGRALMRRVEEMVFHPRGGTIWSAGEEVSQERADTGGLGRRRAGSAPRGGGIA